LTRYAYFAQLGDLKTLGDITVQLTCHSPASTARIVLLAEQPFQRLTLSPFGPEACRLSMSHSDAPAEAPDGAVASLAESTLRTLKDAIQADQVLGVEVHRDEHAALALTPGANLLRPLPQSPVSNFLVDGAWTDTGWPASVESAILSARRCAESIRNADV
jgi:Flavin containing amine oxidoreductase